MKTETYTLPAYWASSLINGDDSGLENGEACEIDQWFTARPWLGSCLDCSDYAEFRTHNDAGTLAGDCLEYTFPVALTQTRENGLEYLVYPGRQFERLLAWQNAGLSYTASGYGKKIPTIRMISIFGRKYRIYCRIFSNAGTCFIVMGGRQVIVD